MRIHVENNALLMLILICKWKEALNCHYDQILDTQFFTFSYTIGLS